MADSNPTPAKRQRGALPSGEVQQRTLPPQEITLSDPNLLGIIASFCDAPQLASLARTCKVILTTISALGTLVYTQTNFTGYHVVPVWMPAGSAIRQLRDTVIHSEHASEIFRVIHKHRMVSMQSSVSGMRLATGSLFTLWVHVIDHKYANPYNCVAVDYDMHGLCKELSY